MNWDRGLIRITFILSIIGAIIGLVTAFDVSIIELHKSRKHLSLLKIVKFDKNDEQRLIDEWKKTYQYITYDETGEEVPLPEAQTRQLENWTGRRLEDEFWEKLNDPNVWGKTKEEQIVILKKRNEELDSLKERGWRTFNGEALPITPKEVWDIQNPTKIEEAEKEVFKNKVLLPIVTAFGSVFGFCFVWICYYFIKVSILLARPILSWIFAGFRDDAQKK